MCKQHTTKLYTVQIITTTVLLECMFVQMSAHLVCFLWATNGRLCQCHSLIICFCCEWANLPSIHVFCAQLVMINCLAYFYSIIWCLTQRQFHESNICLFFVSLLPTYSAWITTIMLVVCYDCNDCSRIVGDCICCHMKQVLCYKLLWKKTTH